MKKKITFIDVLIVLVVIAAAVIVLSKVTGGSSSAVETVSYNVMVIDVLPEVAANVAAEDNVLVDTKDNAFGRVTAVNVKPSEDTYFNEKTEKYVTYSTTERMDVFLTVEVDAVKKDSGYQIGQQKIRVGEKQDISSQTYALNGYIIEVLD